MTHLALFVLLSAAPGNQPGVYTLKNDAFVETARGDLKTLKMFIQGMARVSSRVTENRTLFSAKKDQVYTPEQKRTLLSTWGSLFAYFSAAEGLRQKYWDFVKLPPTDLRHAWGFVLTHTALTALLAHGTAFADLALNNKQLETLFDEANGEFGIPAGAFGSLKLTSIHVATATQLVTGDTWRPATLPLLKTSRALDEPDVQWAMQEMKRDSKTARDALLRKGVKLFAGNAKDIVQDEAARAVFPAQKAFAEWAGDTRVARVGKPLVTREVVDKVILPKLTPGDILVSRQNWFLSNIGLPGFWPHAMLYVGTPKELAAAFDDDPEVKGWLEDEGKAKSFAELLSKRYPAKWKAYAEGQDFQGHGPIRVIESISEGVSFTAVEHAFGVDYLAALRPRLSKVDKARAIERAFWYQGRPYDFDFDFFSDATLVCTELVFKAYQPASDSATGFHPTMKGLRLPLVDVAGRRTLPANEIVKLFDAELDSPARQLDFVFFVDGKEKEATTAEADAKALRESWKRVKWDVAQK